MCFVGDVFDGLGWVLVLKGCELIESMLNGLIWCDIVVVMVECEFEEDLFIWVECWVRVVVQFDYLFCKVGDGLEICQLYGVIFDFCMDYQL